MDNSINNDCLNQAIKCTNILLLSFASQKLVQHLLAKWLVQSLI